MNTFEKEFFLGFVRIHILHHAVEAEVYGTWLMSELAIHGYRLSPGTLYPMLHSMETSGLLKSRHVQVHGKVRRYYKATAKGAKQFDRSRSMARELLMEVL